MAVTDKSGAALLIEHTNNTGVTAVPITYSISLTNASMADKGALDVVTTIPGIMQAGTSTSTLVSWRAINSQSSGTPHKKKCRIHFFSQTGYPATTPAVGTAITLINTDAPYLIGYINILDTDWVDISSTVSVCQGTCAIRFHSDDATKSTNTYCLVTNVHGSAWTPDSGEKLEFDFNWELN